MKLFSKEELVALLVIFLILIGVSWPNFSLSLRRSRDQIRRDDIGNVQGAIDAYYADYGIFPFSSDDGKIIACKDENDNGEIKYDINGNVQIDMVPCDWGQDTWKNLTPGIDKTYLKVIPGDPDSDKGIEYKYFSDGSRYQLFASMEGIDEPGYDNKLELSNFECGKRACNLGRAHNVPLYITIEEYNLQIYCGQHQNDVKCINGS